MTYPLFGKGSDRDGKRDAARAFLAGNASVPSRLDEREAPIPASVSPISAFVPAAPSPSPAAAAISAAPSSDNSLKEQERHLSPERMADAAHALEGEERTRAREEAARAAMAETLRAERAREEAARKAREAEEAKRREAERIAAEAERVRREEEDRQATIRAKAAEAAEARAKYTEEMIVQMKRRRAAINKQEGIVEEAPPPPPKEKITAPLRTLVVDAATAIRERGDSLSKLRLEEQKKKAEERARAEAERSARRKVFGKRLELFGVLISLFGSVAGFALYVNPGIVQDFFPVADTGETAATIVAPALVAPDEEKNIRVEGDPSAAITAAAGELSVPVFFGTIKHVYFTEQKTLETAEGVEREQARVGTARFLELWAPAIDDSFRRALGGEFMLGARAGASGSATPFLIFQVNDFERAFAGMLAWEEFMREDTDALWFGAEGGGDAPALGGFRDAAMEGKDARILSDAAGNTILIYSFVSPDMLLITKNRGAFGEVLNKLEK